MRDGALALRCCRRLLNVPSGGRSLFFADHRDYSGKLLPPNRAQHRTALRRQSATTFIWAEDLKRQMPDSAGAAAARYVFLFSIHRSASRGQIERNRDEEPVYDWEQAGACPAEVIAESNRSASCRSRAGLGAQPRLTTASVQRLQQDSIVDLLRVKLHCSTSGATV